MNIKKIWMSPDMGNKHPYAVRVLGGIIGIIALMLLLIWGGTILSFQMSGNREMFLALLCLGGTALTVCLALRLGWRTIQDATVFFLTWDDRLYAMDARALSYHGDGVLGYAAGTVETQKFLRHMAEKPFIPAGADEVLKVERMKENRAHFAIVCQVRHPNRQVVRRTYFLVKGYTDEKQLLSQLELRKSWKNGREPTDDRATFRMLLSALVSTGFTALCVLSHPAMARLPQEIYFPCLGIALMTFCVAVYFAILRRRGE